MRRLAMSARLSVVFLVLGGCWVGIVGLTRCPPLSAPRHGAVACFWGKKKIGCASNLLVGSVAKYTCLEFYRLSPERQTSSRCLWNGSWSSVSPQCIPDCGKTRSSVSLIVNGAEASREDFPWHVAVYYLVDGNYEYSCGGSLISEVAVVTAAHCVWGVPAEKLMLAFGKFHRKYNLSDKGSQKKRARRVEMLTSYQDVTGNYNGDVAVIFLEGRVRVDFYCSPVCVDWKQRLVDKQLREGSWGVTAGWGLTENDTLGDSLRAVKLPVVPQGKCIEEQETDFKKFVTYTSFCAGFGNGTGVCNGDSGGGLVFLEETSGRWYLQGLVSVSPRRKGTPFCDLNFYTVFTKVGAFIRWLKAVIKSEMEPFEGSKHDDDKRPVKGKLERFYTSAGKIKEKQIIFPHSEKMLELARLGKTYKKHSSQLHS